MNVEDMGKDKERAEKKCKRVGRSRLTNHERLLLFFQAKCIGCPERGLYVRDKLINGSLVEGFCGVEIVCKDIGGVN